MTPLAALTFEQTALLLSWVAILLLAFALSGLVRQVHAVTEAVAGGQRRASGPSVGTIVPALPNLDGASSTLLLFADVGCGSCEQAVARIARAAREHHGVAHAVLYRGAGPATRPAEVAVVTNAGAHFDALGVSATPLAVAVDGQRRVVTSALVGAPALLDEFLADLSVKETQDDHLDAARNDA
ncbi:MAG TPA: hypothetical protein VK891_17945 [Euzebyales bacterium]|nr:hypothetical protein [Euzebyales bacterium]